jgi:hypothetical protein
MADKKTVTRGSLRPSFRYHSGYASVAWGQGPEMGVVVYLFSTTDQDSGAFTYDLVPTATPLTR